MAVVLIGPLIACFPDLNAQAQDSKRDFVNQTELAMWFQEIFPAFKTSRCATPAIVSTMNYVTGLRLAGSPLRIGDQIVAINGNALKTYSEGALPHALSTIGPDEKITMTVARQGERMDLPIGCDDSLPMYSAMRGVYRAIVARDFAGCLERIPALISAWGGMRADTRRLQNYCQLFAKQMTRKDWPQAMFEYYRLLLEEARWDPADFMAARREILGSREFFRQRHREPLIEELERQLEATRWPTAITRRPDVSQ